MRDELRESLALFPRRSKPWIRIAEPTKSSVNKFIRRGSSSTTGTLSVKRPAKNKLSGTIMFSSHSHEPMIHER
jgi:hypothetical protein